MQREWNPFCIPSPFEESRWSHSQTHPSQGDISACGLFIDRYIILTWNTIPIPPRKKDKAKAGKGSARNWTKNDVIWKRDPTTTIWRIPITLRLWGKKVSRSSPCLIRTCRSTACWAMHPLLFPEHHGVNLTTSSITTQQTSLTVHCKTKTQDTVPNPTFKIRGCKKKGQRDRPTQLTS